MRALAVPVFPLFSSVPFLICLLCIRQLYMSQPPLHLVFLQRHIKEGFGWDGHLGMTECELARPFVFASCVKGPPAPSWDLGRAALRHMRCDPGSPCVWRHCLPTMLRRTSGGGCVYVPMYYQVTFHEWVRFTKQSVR